MISASLKTSMRRPIIAPSKATSPVVRYVHDVVVRPSANKVYISKGPGGRSSVSGQTATVFGCTGFLGRYVVNNLAKAGTTVVIPYRGSDDDRRHLKVMGDLGQIVPLRFDLRNETQIAESVRHSDVVYNLIGRDYPTKNFSFEKVHVEGSRTIAKMARENGVSKFIHVSALNADVNSKSDFLRTKALGEKAVLEEFPEATIVRPATMFGHEDRFINRVGWFMKWTVPSYVPLPSEAANNIVRPVYVGDVANMLSRMLKDDRSIGKLVELVGPHSYHIKDVIHYIQESAARQGRIFYIPKVIAKPAAGLWDSVLANPVVSADAVERVSTADSLTSESLKFEDLDIKPHTLEELIVRFVWMYRPPSLSRAPFTNPRERFITA